MAAKSEPVIRFTICLPKPIHAKVALLAKKDMRKVGPMVTRLVVQAVEGLPLSDSRIAAK